MTPRESYNATNRRLRKMAASEPYNVQFTRELRVRQRLLALLNQHGESFGLGHIHKTHAASPADHHYNVNVHGGSPVAVGQLLVSLIPGASFFPPDALTCTVNLPPAFVQSITENAPMSDQPTTTGSGLQPDAPDQSTAAPDSPPHRHGEGPGVGSPMVPLGQATSQLVARIQASQPPPADPDPGDEVDHDDEIDDSDEDWDALLGEDDPIQELPTDHLPDPTPADSSAPRPMFGEGPGEGLDSLPPGQTQPVPDFLAAVAQDTAQRPPKIPLGTRVRLKEPYGSLPAGAEGTVWSQDNLSVPGKLLSDRLWINFGNLGTQMFHAFDLEPISAAASPQDAAPPDEPPADSSAPRPMFGEGTGVGSSSAEADSLTVPDAWKLWLSISPTARGWLQKLQTGEPLAEHTAAVRRALQTRDLIEGKDDDLTFKGRTLLRIIDRCMFAPDPQDAAKIEAESTAQVRSITQELLEKASEVGHLTEKLDQTGIELARAEIEARRKDALIEKLERQAHAPKPTNELDQRIADLQAENAQLRQQIAAQPPARPPVQYYTHFEMDTTPAFIDGLIANGKPILAIVGGGAKDNYGFRDTINVVFLEPHTAAPTVGEADAALFGASPAADPAPLSVHGEGTGEGLTDPARLEQLYQNRKQTLGSKRAGQLTFGGAARAQRAQALDQLLEDLPLAQAVREFGPEAVVSMIQGNARQAGAQAAAEQFNQSPTPANVRAFPLILSEGDTP